MLDRPIASITTLIILILRVLTTSRTYDFQLETSYQMTWMVQILLRPFTNLTLTLNCSGHLFSLLLGLPLNLITSSTTLGKKELFLQCSEENTPLEDTLLARKDVSHANSVKLPVLLSLLLLSPNQDLMALEEPLSTILT